MDSLLELFSGIGGMRTAFHLAGYQFSQVTSVDMSLNCHNVYRKVFGCNDKEVAKDVCSLSLDWFEKLNASIWSMSPPCQPYTRQGNQLNEFDTRNKALDHIIKFLEDMTRLPKLVLLENVDGFQRSESCAKLVQVLQTRGFNVKGYLVNPLDYGFPNSRLRFYLIARNDHHSNEFQVLTELSCSSESSGCVFKKHTISEFIDSESNQLLIVPDSLLEKASSVVLDVVADRSKQSLCFTGNYGRWLKGAGSVLMLDPSSVSTWDNQSRPLLNLTADRMNELTGNIRYFSPFEISRLQGFKCDRHVPMTCLTHSRLVDFKLDDEPDYKEALSDIPLRTAFKVLGNSLNPRIVAMILKMNAQ